jgi:IstB-like ATP binding protein
LGLACRQRARPQISRSTPARPKQWGSSPLSIGQRCDRGLQHRRVDRAGDPHPSPGRKLDLDRPAAGRRRAVAGLAKAHGERCLDEKLLALAKPKLLIVDELGYLPLEPDAAHLFFQLVSRRYETGAMLITSNRSVAEWGTVFAESTLS